MQTDQRIYTTHTHTRAHAPHQWQHVFAFIFLPQCLNESGWYYLRRGITHRKTANTHTHTHKKNTHTNKPKQPGVWFSTEFFFLHSSRFHTFSPCFQSIFSPSTWALVMCTLCVGKGLRDLLTDVTAQGQEKKDPNFLFHLRLNHHNPKRLAQRI